MKITMEREKVDVPVHLSSLLVL